jgi:hypothetical protein
MSLTNLNNRALAVTAASAVFAAMAAPGLASGAKARSAGNEPESGAAALYSVVRSAYSRDLSGRSIETQCTGRRSPYACSWWIIKGSKERRKAGAHAADYVTVPVLLRGGEGNAHKTRSRVYKSGYASAAYNSRTGGFSISLG